MILLTPGANVWRIEHADRFSVLVDGAAYFGAVRRAALKAQHSIAIMGWELDSRTRHRTFPARFPLLNLDRIYCRPASALLSSHVDRAGRTVSDHLPVIAEIRP